MPTSDVQTHRLVFWAMGFDPVGDRLVVDGQPPRYFAAAQTLTKEVGGFLTYRHRITVSSVHSDIVAFAVLALIALIPVPAASRLRLTISALTVRTNRGERAHLHPPNGSGLRFDRCLDFARS
jgi:hypothetical protein